MQIIKYTRNKIKKSICDANEELYPEEQLTDLWIEKIIDAVDDKISSLNRDVSPEEIHDFIISELENFGHYSLVQVYDRYQL